MRRVVTVGGIALLVGLVWAAGVAVPAANEAWRPTPTGTWYFTTGVGPGAALPALATFHEDGTLVYSDATMFGGLLSIVPGKFSPYHGVWRVTGHDRFGGTSIGLLFNPADNVMVGFARARSALRFEKDGHVVGTIYVETAYCAGPVVCPDPTDPATQWTPFGDPNGFPVSLSRLSRVPAGPLQ